VLVISNCRTNGFFRFLMFVVLSIYIGGCSGYRMGRLPADSLGEPGPQSEAKEIKVGHKVKIRLVQGGDYKGQVLSCNSESLSIRTSDSKADTLTFSVVDIGELKVEDSSGNDALVTVLFFGVPLALVLAATLYAPTIGE